MDNDHGNNREQKRIQIFLSIMFICYPLGYWLMALNTNVGRAIKRVYLYTMFISISCFSLCIYEYAFSYYPISTMSVFYAIAFGGVLSEAFWATRIPLKSHMPFAFHIVVNPYFLCILTDVGIGALLYVMNKIIVRYLGCSPLSVRLLLVLASLAAWNILTLSIYLKDKKEAV